MARDLYGDMLSRALQRQAPSGHFPAYITPFEAGLLRSRGGGVPPGGGQYMAGGIPAFMEPSDDGSPGGGVGASGGGGGGPAEADIGLDTAIGAAVADAIAEAAGAVTGFGAAPDDAAAVADAQAEADAEAAAAAAVADAHEYDEVAAEAAVLAAAVTAAQAEAEAQGSLVDPISGIPSPTGPELDIFDFTPGPQHGGSFGEGGFDDPSDVGSIETPGSGSAAQAAAIDAETVGTPTTGYGSGNITTYDLNPNEIAALSRAVSDQQAKQDQQGFFQNLFTFTVPQGRANPVTGQPEVVDSVNVPAVVGTMLGTVLGIPGLGLAGQALGESMMGQMVDTSPTPDFGDPDTEGIGGPSDQELESIERVRREEEERKRKEEAAEEAAQSSFDPPIIDTSTIDEATRQRILANVLSGLQRIERPTEGVTAFGPAFV